MFQIAQNINTGCGEVIIYLSNIVLEYANSVGGPWYVICVYLCVL